ncbi:MAG: bifunctional 5,10-methylenetetrahydrofolate dehydrogenase/5,10-methenyltetrahydrofolate cyclohydrolase [Thermoproteota archaeon]|nr:bifunctional 5,10-methylenetetrahydrofolate dehydrogenase/5,10-methenyltetrahydrofolate cyclohydrolase [Thermoproteota archaeon]
MAAKIIDGLRVSESIKKSLEIEISELNKKNIFPCLSTILVGNDPASATYINNKQKTAKTIGIKTMDYRLDGETSQKDLLDLIIKLNADHDIHGILVQLPLPKHLNKFEIVNSINYNKDVDGLTLVNSGLLLNNRAKLIPCTPLGVMELLKYYDIELDGLTATIINRSNLVGKPLATLMLEKNATVTICHSHTKNMRSTLLNSDVIVTAVGNREKFVLTADMVSENSIIIDVGTSRINGKLFGDVDFEKVKEKVAYLTPVPGGVGPMTISMLLNNTVQAAKTINHVL